MCFPSSVLVFERYSSGSAFHDVSSFGIEAEVEFRLAFVGFEISSHRPECHVFDVISGSLRLVEYREYA
mgnify:CR=1 FL=1